MITCSRIECSAMAKRLWKETVDPPIAHRCEARRERESDYAAHPEGGKRFRGMREPARLVRQSQQGDCADATSVIASATRFVSAVV